MLEEETMALNMVSISILRRRYLKKMHECTLKSTLHIESRVKQLKKHYNAICEMKGPRGGSGFGWNDKDKMIVVEKEILKNG